MYISENIVYIIIGFIIAVGLLLLAFRAPGAVPGFFGLCSSAGVGSAAGYGVYLVVGRVGLALLGTAFGVGWFPFTVAGAVLGLATHAVIKLR